MDNTGSIPKITCVECERKCSATNHFGTRYLCRPCHEIKNFCEGCGEIKQYSSLKNGNCRACRKLTDAYTRICYRCRVGKIGPEEPDEVDMCPECFVDAYTRQCSVCKKKTIYPNAPSFVSVCYGCQNSSGKIASKTRNDIREKSSTLGTAGGTLPKCTTKGCDTVLKETWHKKCPKCYAKGL